MGRKLYDMTGMRFGRYTVIKRAGSKTTGESTWLCQCDCGNIHIVRGSRLRNGSSTSCGCYANEIASTHKMSKTRLHKIWSGMKQRCYNQKNKKYKNYGNRGIIVCDEWLNSFEMFRDWALSHGYADNLTIDRIKTNGNYEPSNCRWADMKTQENNRTNNRVVEYKGKIHTVSEWSEITGIPAKTLYDRLTYKKWTMDDVFTRPIKVNASGLVPKQYSIEDFT